MLGYFPLSSEKIPVFRCVLFLGPPVEAMLSSNFALCFTGKLGGFALTRDAFLWDKLVYSLLYGVTEEAPHFIRRF